MRSKYKKKLKEGKEVKRWKNRTERKKMQNPVDLMSLSNKDDKEERKERTAGEGANKQKICLSKSISLPELPPSSTILSWTYPISQKKKFTTGMHQVASGVFNKQISQRKKSWTLAPLRKLLSLNS